MHGRTYSHARIISVVVELPELSCPSRKPLTRRRSAPAQGHTWLSENRPRATPNKAHASGRGFEPPQTPQEPSPAHFRRRVSAVLSGGKSLENRSSDTARHQGRSKVETVMYPSRSLIGHTALGASPALFAPPSIPIFRSLFFSSPPSSCFHFNISSLRLSCLVAGRREFRTRQRSSRRRQSPLAMLQSHLGDMATRVCLQAGWQPLVGLN